MTVDAGLRRRRGHTKSRLGCISCKKRKIKCQETWPACANCVKRGIACRYSIVFKHLQHDRTVSEVVGDPRPLARLSGTPTVFSAKDMRLFHHFLIAAHPSGCVPQANSGEPHMRHDAPTAHVLTLWPENEAVWTRDVPTLSHQYDYLMHALLAFSGSHLALLTDDPHVNMALNHRQMAIKGLEKANRWHPKPEEAHVILATSFLLAFQAPYVCDGMVDHILALRACAVLSRHILDNDLAGWFLVHPNINNAWLESKLRDSIALDQGLARDALGSLAKIAPLLSLPTARSLHRTLFAQLVECIRPLLLPTEELGSTATPRASPKIPQHEDALPPTSRSPAPSSFTDEHIPNPIVPGRLAMTFEQLWSEDVQLITNIPSDHKHSPTRAFNALMSSLLVLTTWPQDEVINLLSLSNGTGNIVLAHYCVIQLVISPLSCPTSATRTPIEAMVGWCECIVDSLEDEAELKWTEYVRWPSRILRTLRCALNRNRGLTYGDVYDILVKDPDICPQAQSWVL